MIRLLAIDTATESCSAALRIGDDTRERAEFAPRGHADLLLPMVESLLAEAGLRLSELDGIAFDRGPGSFTGIRIGVSAVQGLAFAADLPVFPVSSLAALAQAAQGEGCDLPVLAAIDARMGEVYWGRYRFVEGLAVLGGRERVDPPEAVKGPGETYQGIGSGWDRYRERLLDAMGEAPAGVIADRFPLARDVITLALPDHLAGKGVAAAQALPVYLRDDVASPTR